MTVGCGPWDGNASVNDLPQLGQKVTDVAEGISFPQCRQNIFYDFLSCKDAKPHVLS